MEYAHGAPVPPRRARAAARGPGRPGHGGAAIPKHIHVKYYLVSTYRKINSHRPIILIPQPHLEKD